MKPSDRLSDERLAEIQADSDAAMARHPVNRTMELHADTTRRLLAELRARRAKDADLRALIESQVASAQGCGDTCPARNDPDCRALDNAAFVDDEDEETRRCRAALLAHFGLPEVPRE